MGREEARAKAWNTFRESMLQRAKEDPDFSLSDFILQRVDTAYNCWRKARNAERRRDYKKARGLYLKASESIEQAEKLIGNPAAAVYVEQLKTEYFNFVVHRDPVYRLNLKYILPLVKAEPGILQTKTYEQVHLPKPEITYALYFAEQEGLVRREKKGRSYQLFFERDKAADEPLLTIQDDEIDIQTRAREAADFKKGCKFILTLFFWFCAMVGLGAAGGLVGAGLVVAAFIAWRIIRKVRHRKQGRTTSVQPQTPPQTALPDNPVENKWK
jgi:hypothetical protein